MPKPFRFTLVGSFHSYELYDRRGREVFNLDEAVEAAEELYGDEWVEVYNGESAAARE